MSCSKSVFNTDWIDSHINLDFSGWIAAVPKNPFAELKNDYKEQFDSFTEDVRLGDFYFTLLKLKEFADLWDVVKLVLILSHGNAAVESGFSINKDMLAENLKEDSLIGLRTVYDTVNFYGGVVNVPLTKDMLQYAKLSRMRYHETLEKQRQSQIKEKEKETSKRKVSQQVKLLQNKKMKVMTQKSVEVVEIDAQISELSKKNN